MNKIWQIIKTEFKIEFAYPLTWVFFLILPIVFTLAIGAALGGSQQTGVDDQPEEILPHLVVINRDQTFLSEKFIGSLENGGDLSVTSLDSGDEVTEELRETTNAYVTIPAGFEQSLVNNSEFTLTLDVANESFTSIAIENEIRSAINHTTAALMALRSSALIQSKELPQEDSLEYNHLSEQFDTAQTLIEEQPLFNLVVHKTDSSQQTPSGMMGFNQSSSGQLVTWSLITLLGGSILFVRDRKDGTYQRMFTTPTSKTIYFIGKVVARMLMGLIQMVILVFFGMYILDVNWGNDPLLLIGFLICFSLAGTSLGLMLGAFCKTTKQADNLTTLLSMLMAALGGAWWPLEITPASYQTIVRVIPSTWAMLGFNDIIIKGQGLNGVLLEGGILLGFAVLFMSIGVLRLQKKMQ